MDFFNWLCRRRRYVFDKVAAHKYTRDNAKRLVGDNVLTVLEQLSPTAEYWSAVLDGVLCMAMLDGVTPYDLLQALQNDKRLPVGPYDKNT